MTRRRKTGPRSLLHGIPVAVKDVIDVAGLPTRANSRSRADAPPAMLDATVVAHLRASGAIILGKVHTTEYAYFESVPPTRNPHDLTRTPGGSSAGSSAAVAAGMVPLALGTQTAGSVNRPAAYTGIGAFKPSTRAISSTGIVPLAPSYDTVGAFGATPQDAVLLAAGYAPEQLRLDDPDPTPLQSITVLEDPLITRKASPAAVGALRDLVDRLRQAGFRIETAASPVSLDDVIADHRIVLLYELGHLHGAIPRHLLAPKLAADIDQGLALPAERYHAALYRLSVARRSFWPKFGRETAVLLPAAPDIAPADGTTGDPAFVIPAHGTRRPGCQRAGRHRPADSHAPRRHAHRRSRCGPVAGGAAVVGPRKRRRPLETTPLLRRRHRQDPDGLLEGAPNFQQQGLAPRRPDQLDCHRQAVAREACGYRQGREAQHIHAAGEAQEAQHHLHHARPVAHVDIRNRRNRYRKHRRDQHIDRAEHVLHHALLQPCPRAHGGHVGLGRDGSPGKQTGAHLG